MLCNAIKSRALPHNLHTNKTPHEWMTPPSFHVNRPSHFWGKAISDSDLETRRSRSRVWSKGQVIHLAQYLINSFPFHFTSIRQTIPEIELFWPWNIQGQGLDWGQRSMAHIIPSIQPMHFLFVSHQSDQPLLRYGQYRVWPWKNTSEIFNENLPKSQFLTTLLQNLIR